MPSVSDDILNFDERAYEEQVHQDLVKKRTIVFALAFSPDGRFLVGGSCFGRIAVWDVRAVLSENEEQSKAARRPCVALEICKDAVYCLRFDGDLLVCGTNRGIRGYNWQAILDAAHMDIDVKPLFDVEPPGANSYIGGIETNGVAIKDGVMYAACGDSKIHAWRLDPVREHPRRRPHYEKAYEGHTDYVHCVEVRQCGQLVSGSEDGTVRLWDIESGRCLNTLEAPVFRKDKKADGSSKDKDKDKDRGSSRRSGSSRQADAKDSKSRSKREHSFEGAAPWIPCIAIDSTDNWLATGGLNAPVVWHIPSLTAASQPNTRGQTVVRSIMFADDELVTVGDNEYICRWSMGGELKAQTQASSYSNYAVCMNMSGPRVVAMSGVGARVDIFISLRYKAFSLDFY